MKQFKVSKPFQVISSQKPIPINIQNNNDHNNGGRPPTAGDGHQPQFPETSGTTTAAAASQLFTPHDAVASRSVVGT